MKLEHCQYILEIYKTGSVNKAAENLCTSPQNISRIKSTVEKKLGTNIFERTDGTLQPTNSGKEFLKFCNTTVKNYAEMMNLIQQNSIQHNLDGTIHIRTSSYIGDFFLNDMILKFKSIYPNVKIKVVNSHIHHGYEYINNNKEGLAILMVDYDPIDYPNICRIDIMNLEFAIGVSTNHSYATLNSLSLQKAIDDQIPVMIFSLGDVEASDTYYMLGEDNLNKLNYDVTSSYNMYQNAISSGMYIGLVCKNTYTADYMQKHNVKLLKTEERFSTYKLSILSGCPKEKMSPCERVFIKFLEKNIQSYMYDQLF